MISLIRLVSKRGNVHKAAISVCLVGGLLSACKELDQGSQRQGAEYTVGALYSIVKQAGSKGEPNSLPLEKSQPVIAQEKTETSVLRTNSPRMAALATGPFAGITIVRLDQPGVGPSPSIVPLTGSATTSYIVVFVSPDGGYAGLLEPHAERCAAWILESHSNPSTLAFGVEEAGPFSWNVRSQQNPGEDLPPVCLPFTLMSEGENSVRVTSATWRSKEIYSRTHKVIARIPLTSVDWSSPALERHAIQGVRLGPIEQLAKGPLAGPFAKAMSANQEPGVLRSFQVELPRESGQQLPKIVNGFVADRRMTGWSSDAVVQAMYGEAFGKPTTNDLFDEAVFEKYGRPTRVEERELQGRMRVVYQWLYDLQGHFLKDTDAGAQNCLGTVQLWGPVFTIHNAMRGMGKGMGPWGCSMVFTLEHGGLLKRGVSEYRVEAISAAAITTMYFRKKLLQVGELASRVEEFRTAKPKL